MKDYEIQSIVSLLKDRQKRWKSPTTTGIKSWQD